MIDSHAHLDDPRFDPDRDLVLSRAHEAGVQSIVSIGMLDADDSFRRAFDLVDRHGAGEPTLFTSLGCHPHDARLFEEMGGEEALLREARRPRLIAIGEVGLDHHYDQSPRPTQADVFRRQIRVARELDLPVVVHQRDAEDDFLRIADEERLADAGAIMHCFTGSARLADAALERGFLISFSGIVTFGNAEELRNTARRIPPDRILVETDCPYLAPVPHRGKRCEPAMVRATLERLARERGESADELEAATDANFRRFFAGRLDSAPVG